MMATWMSSAPKAGMMMTKPASAHQNLAGPEGARDGILEFDLLKVAEVPRVEVGHIKTKSTSLTKLGLALYASCHCG